MPEAADVRACVPPAEFWFRAKVTQSVGVPSTVQCRSSICRDPQRPGEREAVRGSAHLRLGGDDINIADLEHGRLKGGYTFGVDTVVVSN